MRDIFGNFTNLFGDKEKRRVRAAADLDFNMYNQAVEPKGKIESREPVHSLGLIRVLVVLLFCLLSLRLFTLQIAQGEAHQKMAEGNRIRPRLLEAARGLITDKNGVWLARNQPAFALAVYPSDLPKKKADRLDLYQKISVLVNLPADEIQKTAEKNGLTSLDEILIKENISHDDALLLEEDLARLQGFFVAKTPIRQYQSDAGMAHLLGYTGLVSDNDLKKTIGYYLSDRIGKNGLEASYENYLKGTHGVEQVEVDSQGNVVKVLVKQENKESISGDDLVLNLDYPLQQKVAAALSAGIESGKALTGSEVTGGVAIVENVQTGGILSMVSLPAYDDNLFAGKISNSDYQSLLDDKGLPMFDRATDGVYPPGSISKIILASAGLQVGTITPNTSIVTPAAITIGDYIFPDWKDHSYETTNVVRALAESNNVFFYSVGGGFDKIKGLGIGNIKKYWQLFGLGSKTGIDLPSEASGLLPDPAWKKAVQNLPWYIGDTYHVSIGQGDLLVTPLQMVNATAAIANGGTLYEPRLAAKILDSSGVVVQEFQPKVIRQGFVDPSVVRTVQAGMRLAITDGSARNLNDLPVSVAGKTGTAQFLNNQKTHAWFTCYAPYENPQIAVTVLVDGGGGGHEIAAPVAKEILNYYFSPKN